MLPMEERYAKEEVRHLEQHTAMKTTTQEVAEMLLQIGLVLYVEEKALAQVQMCQQCVIIVQEQQEDVGIVEDWRDNG